jgi:hypothetical protein
MGIDFNNADLWTQISLERLDELSVGLGVIEKACGTVLV